MIQYKYTHFVLIHNIVQKKPPSTFGQGSKTHFSSLGKAVAGRQR